jgi:hypothetical protein
VQVVDGGDAPDRAQALPDLRYQQSRDRLGLLEPCRDDDDCGADHGERPEASVSTSR